MLSKDKGKKNEGETDEDWDIFYQKVMGLIRLSFAKSVAYNILKEKTTFDLMAALVEM